MKTKIVIETASEMIDCADRSRPEGDTTPFIGGEAKVVIPDLQHAIRLVNAPRFEVEEVLVADLIIELAKRCGVWVTIG